MKKTIATDVLFDHEPDPDHLREVAARAFGVDLNRVAVGALHDDPEVTSESQIVFQRQPEDMPGDFPAWYGLSIEVALFDKVDSALNTVAHQLGLVALSDATSPEEMTLHLPDGSGRVVHLPQGDNDGFHLTNGLEKIIGSSRRNLGTANDVGLSHPANSAKTASRIRRAAVG